MSGNRIIIVDDDKTTADVMKLYLENFGFKVVGIAFNGAEAIDKTRRQEPDLVLMDINLGTKGLDGIDSAEVIMKKFDVPVIYVTAHSDEDTLERAQMSNPYGFINKPIRDIDLKTTIRLALDKKGKKPKQNSIKNIEDALRKVYDFSPAEARAIALLSKNPDVDFAAKKLNLSVSTVRTHLKNCYRKTNTKNLSSLIHKIITGPASLITEDEEN